MKWQKQILVDLIPFALVSALLFMAFVQLMDAQNQFNNSRAACGAAIGLEVCDRNVR